MAALKITKIASTAHKQKIMYPEQNKPLLPIKKIILIGGGFLFVVIAVIVFFLVNKPAPTEPEQGGEPQTTSPRSDSPKKDEPAPPAATPEDTSKKSAAGSTGSSGSGSTGSSSGGTSGSSGGSDSGGGGGGTTPNPCDPGTHVAGGSDDTGGCWPGPNNTGVPSMITLSTYAGPCVITADNTTIDSKTVNCDLEVHAANFTLKNSKVNGLVFLDTDLGGSGSWSMTVIDSEVDAGTQQRAAISVGNMTVLRANLHGGQTGAQCEETGSFCSITDSWLHGQYLPDDQPWHLGGFLSDGGVNMTLRHNTIVCDHAVNSVNEGCTGDVNLIPNFAPISGALIEHNLLGANVGSSYCTYGGEKFSSPTPHSDHVVYKDNIFQRGTNNQCAAFGPVTNFDINQPGNQWVNNRWADGGIVDPAN